MRSNTRTVSRRMFCSISMVLSSFYNDFLETKVVKYPAFGARQVVFNIQKIAYRLISCTERQRLCHSFPRFLPAKPSRSAPPEPRK